MTDLTLLHTADAHRPRFERLRDRIAPDLAMTQVVRAEWLERARVGIDATLKAQIAEEIMRASGPVLCTCTTLGPVAEAAGAVRVDWPMMQAAARLRGPILMAFCLQSTFAPSLALLERAMAQVGAPQTVYPLALIHHWPLFEAESEQDFAGAIAADVREAIAAHRDVAVVILAQASMDGAAELLADLGIPVLSSPELAFRDMLQRGEQSTAV